MAVPCRSPFVYKQLNLMATSYGWFFVSPVQNLPGWGSRLVDIGQHTCPQGPWARPGQGTGVPDLAPPPSAPSSQLTGSAEGLLHSLGNHGRGTSLVSDAEVERDERGNVPQLGFHVALGTNAEKVSNSTQEQCDCADQKFNQKINSECHL